MGAGAGPESPAVVVRSHQNWSCDLLVEGHGQRVLTQRRESQENINSPVLILLLTSSFLTMPSVGQTQTEARGKVVQ